MFLSSEALSTFDPATQLVIITGCDISLPLLFGQGNYPVLSNYLVKREMNNTAVTTGSAAVVYLEYFPTCGWLISYLCKVPNGYY